MFHVIWWCSGNLRWWIFGKSSNADFGQKLSQGSVSFVACWATPIVSSWVKSQRVAIVLSRWLYLSQGAGVWLAICVNKWSLIEKKSQVTPAWRESMAFMVLCLPPCSRNGWSYFSFLLVQPIYICLCWITEYKYVQTYLWSKKGQPHRLLFVLWLFLSGRHPSNVGSSPLFCVPFRKTPSCARKTMKS